MRIQRKSVILLLSVLSVLAITCFFVGCGGNPADGSGHKHNYDDVFTCRDATCTECGHVRKGTGHVFKEDVPPCKKATCSVCGYRRPAAEHTVQEWVCVVRESCTEDGEYSGVCSLCNETVVKIVPKTGHTFESGAECESRVCSVCGKTVGATAAHQVEEWNTAEAATCHSEGTRTGVCSVCKKEVAEKIPMTAHSYDSGKVVKAATCEADGETRFTCTARGCGHTKTQPIPRLEHTRGEKLAERPATCTGIGWNEYRCTVCGNSYKDDYAAALGHAYSEEKFVEATCESTGGRVKTCTRCNHESVRDFQPRKAHNFENGSCIICKKSWDTAYKLDAETLTHEYLAEADKYEFFGESGKTGYDDGTWTLMIRPEIVKAYLEQGVPSLTLRFSPKAEGEKFTMNVLYGTDHTQHLRSPSAVLALTVELTEAMAEKGVTMRIYINDFYVTTPAENATKPFSGFYLDIRYIEPISAEKPWTWEFTDDGLHTSVISVKSAYDRETNAFDFSATTKKVTNAWFYCTMNAQAIDLMLEAGYTLLEISAVAADAQAVTVDYVGKSGTAPEITASPASIDLAAVKKAINGNKKWYLTFKYTAKAETESMIFSVKFQPRKGA